MDRRNDNWHRQFTCSRLVWYFCPVNGQSIGSLDSGAVFSLAFVSIVHPSIQCSVLPVYGQPFSSLDITPGCCIDGSSVKSKVCQSSQLSVLRFIGLSTDSLLLLASTDIYFCPVNCQSNHSLNSVPSFHRFFASIVLPSIQWSVRPVYGQPFGSLDITLLFRWLFASMVLPSSPRFVSPVTCQPFGLLV